MNNFLDHNQIARLYGANLIDGIELYRRLALEIDKTPENINHYIGKLPIVHMSPDNTTDCLDRTKFIEALSYGDSGVLLASPGASLAGLMVRELGNESQKKYFFDYVTKQNSATFLAVTEPTHGSNANNMQAKLTKTDHATYCLNAEKWLVGHGADANIGVLIAKISDGPLGMVAILITPELLNSSDNKNTYFREHLNTVGLNGARLSKLVFKDFVVPIDNILGNHLHPAKRGMMALIKTFNQMRPCVAAFALGHAQAVIDYTTINKHSYSPEQKYKLNEVTSKISIIRELLYYSANNVDFNPYETSWPSLVKYKSSNIAEEATTLACDIFGADILEHPLLLKWSRDVWGYEYMEGTTFIHLKNVYQGYLRNTFL